MRGPNQSASLAQSLGHDLAGLFEESATAPEFSAPLVMPEDPVSALKIAAEGNFLGMVDERTCLSLIAGMNEGQRRDVWADDDTMEALAKAFNRGEQRAMLEMLNASLADFIGSPTFSLLFSEFPSGARLTTTERRDLYEAALQASGSTLEKLFEKRFNVEVTGRLEDTEGNEVFEASPIANQTSNIQWADEDLRDVWEILNTLPDKDVSQNTALDAFQAISGNRGFWSSSRGDVMLGQTLNDSGASRIEHTVRHEIGHAVHTQLRSTVDSWLDNEIGFVILGQGRDGCEALVNQLGGFPGPVDKSHVLDLLDGYLNRGSWSADTPIAAFDPDWQMMPLSVKDATVSSNQNWYQQYSQHPRGDGGRVFFNHYYENTMMFSAVAEAAIDATGVDYSAMSPNEFFANCYAEYFHDPAGFTHPNRWGGGLPSSVKAFFKNVIVDRQPYAPPESSATISPNVSTRHDTGA
jgi:hypothetical protein